MSTATPSDAATVVRLRWDMIDGTVTVTPQDQDRFSIRVRHAIEMLRQGHHAEKFNGQFRLLLRLLAEWLKDRTDIEKAFLTHRDGSLSFVVVKVSCEYDDEFEDSLSDLDFGIANDTDLDLIKIDAIALPPTSETALRSFLDPEFTCEYVGQWQQNQTT